MYNVIIFSKSLIQKTKSLIQTAFDGLWKCKHWRRALSCMRKFARREVRSRFVFIASRWASFCSLTCSGVASWWQTCRYRIRFGWPKPPCAIEQSWNVGVSLLGLITFSLAGMSTTPPPSFQTASTTWNRHPRCVLRTSASVFKFKLNIFWMLSSRKSFFR